jgi:hypothetical protein
MKYLYDAALAQPLLAFALAFYVVIVLGAEVRKHNTALTGVVDSLKEHERRQIKKNKLLRAMSLPFVSMIVFFAMFPYSYEDFMPIHHIELPIFNLVGLVLIIASFAKMLIEHLDMDKELFRQNMEGRRLDSASLISYSRRMVENYFAMFIGLTLILANWICVVLLIIAAFSYRPKTVERLG